MKPLLADVHMHSIVSGHAFGTIREMAAQAAQRNLKLIGVTEHAPGIPGTCDSIYFRNFVDAPRMLYGVEMLYGCEVNLLNGGGLSLEERSMKCLDYAIVGIHRQCYDDAGAIKNTDDLIASMEHSKVRFVSHPDNDKYPLYFPALVQAAKDLNVALEVNNASLRKQKLRPGCYENYRKLLPMCMEAGVPIIVNTDSHDPETVGDFALAEQLLQEIGVPDDLILNNDIQRLKQFLLNP